MAIPTCSQCEEQKFELVLQQPPDAKHAFSFVQCAACGTVVGVIEERKINEALLRRIAEKVGADLTGI